MCNGTDTVFGKELDIKCLIKWCITVLAYSYRTQISPMYIDVRKFYISAMLRQKLLSLILCCLTSRWKLKQVLLLLVFKIISGRSGYSWAQVQNFSAAESQIVPYRSKMKRALFFLNSNCFRRHALTVVVACLFVCFFLKALLTFLRVLALTL